jgi:poly(beta-D-mannuronate) lyase
MPSSVQQPDFWLRVSRRLLLLSTGALLISSSLSARDRLARNEEELAVLIETARPGDDIILANKQWRNVDIKFAAQGTAKKPITLRAMSPGKVIVTGTSTLRVAGRHLVVKDLVFRSGQPLGEAAIVTRINNVWAEDTRLTGIVIDGFSNPNRRIEDHWVALYGRNIRFDHSHFEGKQNAGAMFVVVRAQGWPIDNRVRIDHNYFGPRPVLGSNTGETIRIGTSEESLSASGSIIENNIFERTDGEVEIISIKSGGNLIQGNLFLRAQGAVVLRHGNANIVQDNIFQGMGVENTGGIRVINRDQIVRNNYMEGLSGRNFTAALSLMNGVPNSVINRYHQVVGGEIANNSLIHPRVILFGAGASAERSAAPDAISVSGNLVVTGNTASPFRIDASTKGIKFTGNVTDAPADEAAGFSYKPITIRRSSNGLLYPIDPALSATGVSQQLKVPKRSETGPAWYRAAQLEKRDKSDGRIVRVRSAEGLLVALKNAHHGDKIELGSGEFELSEPLKVQRSITLSGSRAKLAFRGTELFNIKEGGSLTLRGLDVSGQSSLQEPGNAVIRTQHQAMLTNYVIDIENCRFSHLARTPSFDLIATTPGTFASKIRISGSEIIDLSGAVVAASSERGAAGLYPAEEIELERLSLTRVGTIANVLRQGTDESTFGPRFTLKDSKVTDSGGVVLSGVQVTQVIKSSFVRSAGIRVTHSVGEPLTRVVDNRFVSTPQPIVTELHYTGPERAEIRDNLSQ